MKTSEEKYKIVCQLIRLGMVKNSKDFSGHLSDVGLTDYKFIACLKAKPDIVVLNWLDSHHSDFEGIGLITKDWIRRNIDISKFTKTELHILGLGE